MCPNTSKFTASNPRTPEAPIGWVQEECTPKLYPAAKGQYMKEVLAEMERLNVTSVIFGDPAGVQKWKDAAPARVIPGTGFDRQAVTWLVSELRLLDPPKLASAAIDKAARSHNPTAIEPGKYTVVLEPAAMADLLVNLAFAADARQADEGRSFFSKKGGGTRVGEQIVGEKVRLYSDPAHPPRRRSRSTGRGCR